MMVLPFDNCPFDVTPFDESSIVKTPNLVNINYTNQDFWSMKTRLIDFIKESFTDDFNDGMWENLWQSAGPNPPTESGGVLSLQPSSAILSNPEFNEESFSLEADFITNRIMPKGVLFF